MLALGSCCPIQKPSPSREQAFADGLRRPYGDSAPGPVETKLPRQGLHSLSRSNQVFNSCATNASMLGRENPTAGFDKAGMKTGQRALRSNLAPSQNLTFFQSVFFVVLRFFFKTMTILLASGLSGPAASATKHICDPLWTNAPLKSQQPSFLSQTPTPTTGKGGMPPLRPRWAGRQRAHHFC